MSEKTLEERLDEAIARSAELIALNEALTQLQSGERERLIILAAEELEKIESENIGEDYCRFPWQW